VVQCYLSRSQIVPVRIAIRARHNFRFMDQPRE